MAVYEKPDAWSLRAQKEGYPARSVYKLKEMDEKFRLIPRGGAGGPKPGDGTAGPGMPDFPASPAAGLPPANLSLASPPPAEGPLDASLDPSANLPAAQSKAGFRVLDLGAAPGSWSLYVLRKQAGRGFLAAADLAPLSRRYDRGLFDGPNFFFVQGDMTAPETRELLLEKGPYNLVISDAAPATTGNRGVDALRSLDLAETALGYAEAALKKGGALVLKIFQGGDSAAFLRKIRGAFDSGRAFKPAACRGESFETYYLGLGRR
ncbi:MAG: RlmE family RNA methyltransferase [Treponema sp.]|jgi:23S rRNA (uridine2552-2'-O)-methyltransferase|nr:RlmE family RNA methyltransferase [Treponema sp.]